MQTTQQIYEIAKVCHEANKAFCETLGDNSQKSWTDAEQWQRDSAIAGVNYRLSNPEAKSGAQHVAWMKDKIKNGWKFGSVKDASKKEHPCLVPFEQLPKEQQLKDYLFIGIIDALKD